MRLSAPEVPNTTNSTLADARRNDACMDAPGWMAATNGQPTPRTWAEKEQRKALWMKAVCRSHAGWLEAVCCERLRPTASRRQHLSTRNARSPGFLTESRQGTFQTAFRVVGSPSGVYRDPVAQLGFKHELTSVTVLLLRWARARHASPTSSTRVRDCGSDEVPQPIETRPHCYSYRHVEHQREGGHDCQRQRIQR